MQKNHGSNCDGAGRFLSLCSNIGSFSKFHKDIVKKSGTKLKTAEKRKEAAKLLNSARSGVISIRGLGTIRKSTKVCLRNTSKSGTYSTNY